MEDAIASILSAALIAVLAFLRFAFMPSVAVVTLFFFAYFIPTLVWNRGEDELTYVFQQQISFVATTAFFWGGVTLTWLTIRTFMGLKSDLWTVLTPLLRLVNSL